MAGREAGMDLSTDQAIFTATLLFHSPLYINYTYTLLLKANRKLLPGNFPVNFMDSFVD